MGDASHVQLAIEAAQSQTCLGKYVMAGSCFHFLKAADLLSGPYRQKMNAATMFCQSKMYISPKPMLSAS